MCTSLCRSALCSFCSPGTYAAFSAAACLPCPGGAFSLGNTSTCQACLAGNFSMPGSSMCIACGVNQVSPGNSSSCQFCPTGYYGDATNTMCIGCTTAPAQNSHYLPNTCPDMCLFQCDVGFVPPDCLTPFQQLVKMFGGTLVFTLSAVGAFLVLMAPFLVCWVRRKRQKRQEILDDMRASGHLVNADVSGYQPIDGSPGPRYHTWAQTPSCVVLLCLKLALIFIPLICSRVLHMPVASRRLLGVLISIFLTSCILLAFCCCCRCCCRYNSSREQQNNMSNKHSRASSMSYNGKDGGKAPLLSLMQMDEWIEQNLHLFDNDTADDVNNHGMYLKSEDLPHHLHRVYFLGQNSSEQPFTLPYTMDAAVEPLLIPEQWRLFVDDMSFYSQVSLCHLPIDVVGNVIS
jgi:hypothetical protein